MRDLDLAPPQSGIRHPLTGVKHPLSKLAELNQSAPRTPILHLLHKRQVEFACEAIERATLQIAEFGPLDPDLAAAIATRITQAAEVADHNLRNAERGER